MIWKNRIRTNPLLRKLIHSDGTEENVTIDDISTNVTQIGTPLDESTLNIQEKNIGTYGDDTYDNTETYSIGDIVTYRGLLYKCTSPIETAENFNASHWEEFSLLSKIQKNEGNIQKNFELLETKLIKETTIVTVSLITTETVAENTDYEIPLNYKVGADVLEIYYMGEKLIKDIHYIEVGNTGAISNTIQFYNWGQSVPTGRTIEFVVRGVYSNES